MRLVLVRASCQMKGVFLGTPGGALASLTPMEIARTPTLLRTGIDAPRQPRHVPLQAKGPPSRDSARCWPCMQNEWHA